MATAVRTPRVQGLAAPIDVDVAIVGAGISGACMAHALAGTGRSVVVLDRRAPLMGSTVASTALVAYEIDRPLFSLARQIGRGPARQAWLRSRAAIGALRSQVLREQIRCDWDDRDTLYLAGSEFGSRALRTETAWRVRAGLPATFAGRSALRAAYGIERTGAVTSTGSAVAHPLRLAAGLLRSAVKRGARLHSPVEVRAVTSRRGRVRLDTDAGHAVVARDVVFCTGYELLPGIPLAGHAVRSTWAFSSAPDARYPEWLDHTVVWEASDPYLYLRTAPGRRIVAGGEDDDGPSRHADRPLLRRKVSALAAKVRELLPGVRFRVGFTWGGSFGDSITGLPLIGRVPGLDGCHVVMGFGGNGFANSVIASEVVTAAIEGRTDPDAALYRLPQS